MKKIVLKNLNQRSLEQLWGLKDKKFKRQNKVESSAEELLGLRNRNQNLLTQIKKLKNYKKPLESKLEELITKQASKSSEVAIQVEEKGTTLIQIVSQFIKIPIQLKGRHTQI